MIEIFVADDIRRHIARSRHALVTILPCQRPALEAVGRRRRQIFIVVKIGAVKPIRLTRADAVRCAFAVRFAFAFTHHDQRRAVLRVDVNAKSARTRDGEGDIGRIDLDAFAGAHPPYLHLHNALRELQLGNAIVDVQQRSAGLRSEAQRRAGHLHFAA